MKLLEVAIGIGAGYFIYTQKGRKDALDGLNMIFDFSKKATGQLVQDLGLNNLFKNNGEVEEANQTKSFEDKEVELVEKDERFQKD